MAEPFAQISDELVTFVLAHVPFMTHGTVRCVCPRFGALLVAPAFRAGRLSWGFAEHGAVAVGGSERFGPRRLAEGWLFKGGQWRPTAPLSAARTSACAALFGSELWVCGGYDGRHIMTAVEAYDPRTNAWRACPPMREPRCAPVAGVVAGALVVAGGTADARSCEAYSPAAGWAALPPMPHRASGASGGVLDGVLYVAGGGEKLQVWDGEAWTVKADLPAARFGATSAVLGGTLLVIGGNVNGETQDSVLAYDPRADAWEAREPLPRPQGGCRAVVEHTGSVLIIGAGPALRLQGGAWQEADLDGAAAAGLKEVTAACASAVLLG